MPAAPAGTEEAEAPQPKVRSIVWDGIHALSESELEAAIVTSERRWTDWRFWRPSPRLDPIELDVDLERIADAYRERGWYQAQATVDLEEVDEGRAVIVHFHVNEGKPVLLDDWALTLADDADLTQADRATLQAQIPSERGQPFGTTLYRQVRQALLDHCADLGYPAARLEGGAQVDLESDLARVEWTLFLGPVITLGRIRLRGIEDIQPKLALRELLFATGDRYSRAKLRESERRLVDTGLFRSAVIEVRPPKNAPEAAVWPVRVQVQKRPPRSVRIGAGYGTEDQFRGQLSWTHRNFFGEARRLDLRARASFLDSALEAHLGQPSLFDSRVRGDLSLSASRQNRPGYEANVYEELSAISFPLDTDEKWRLRLGQHFQTGTVTEWEFDRPAPRGPKQTHIHGPVAGLLFQDTDDKVDPHRGVRAEAVVEMGGIPTGSELTYVEAQLDLRGYLPLGPTVLAARTAMATLEPFAGDGLGDVPVYRRLYTGGTYSVRGYPYQGIGPLDGDDTPIGGLSRAEFSLEWRFPIWKRLSGVGFIDGGQVRREAASWQLGNFEYGAGGGLRFSTPIGPIRLDVATPIDARSSVNDYRIHLSVGQMF